MRKKRKHAFIRFLIFAFLMLGLCAALRFIDVQNVTIFSALDATLPPKVTQLGLAGVNLEARSLLGYNEDFDQISKYMELASVLVGTIFALTGLYQLLTRKSFAKVDRNLYFLAGLYIVLFALYVFFTKYSLNVRPYMFEEGLENSFPSSHTMMAVVMFGSAAVVLGRKLRGSFFCIPCVMLLYLIMAAAIATRVLSGVHWATDILGGILLGFTLVSLFHYILLRFAPKKKKKRS